MGEANRHKRATEEIRHEELYIAYRNWVNRTTGIYESGYCRQPFDAFLGFDFSHVWHSKSFKTLPHIARKIRLMNSAHWYTLLKARKAKRSS